MKPQPGKDIASLLTVGTLALLGLSLTLELTPALTALVFATGAVLGYLLLSVDYTPLLDRWRGKRNGGPRSEFGDRIAERLADCRQREEQFRDEGERILNSIATLRDDLDRNTGVAAEEIVRAEGVIKELEAEFSLRHAKASFFADCAAKLEELLARHRLVESIAARRRELREMRQNNFDDEAAVEETRFGIEQDSIELDTIVELSQSAVTTDKTAQTQDLRDRLEQLRSSLGKQNEHGTAS